MRPLDADGGAATDAAGGGAVGTETGGRGRFMEESDVDVSGAMTGGRGLMAGVSRSNGVRGGCGEELGTSVATGEGAGGILK